MSTSDQQNEIADSLPDYLKCGVYRVEYNPNIYNSVFFDIIIGDFGEFVIHGIEAHEYEPENEQIQITMPSKQLIDDGCFYSSVCVSFYKMKAIISIKRVIIKFLKENPAFGQIMLRNWAEGIK